MFLLAVPDLTPSVWLYLLMSLVFTVSFKEQIWYVKIKADGYLELKQPWSVLASFKYERRHVVRKKKDLILILYDIQR